MTSKEWSEKAVAVQGMKIDPDSLFIIELIADLSEMEKRCAALVDYFKKDIDKYERGWHVRAVVMPCQIGASRNHVLAVSTLPCANRRRKGKRDDRRMLSQ